MSAVVVGPQSYANFHAFANGDARLRTEEVNLYSDGRFSLEWRNGRSLPVSVGPVTLIAMERPEETTWGPAIVMRYAVYYELPEHHDFEASSTSQYTGSSPYASIACLPLRTVQDRAMWREASHDLWRLDPWDEPAMEKALRIVYQHRSKALHEAIPFPDPMCEPPMVDSQEPEAPCEIITGYSMSSSTGGSWPSEKMPFGLHLFEYIVRTSLLAWWKSVTPDAITNAETAGDSNSSLQ